MKENSQVSNDLSNKILADIKNKINPDIKIIFLKLFIIHLGSAIGTLSICPQLGASTFKTHLNLIHHLNFFGAKYCDLTCGIFFTGVSMVIALLILSRDEIRVLKFNKFYTASVLILFSLSFLLMLNPNLFLEFSILWLLGTMLGTIGVLEIGGRILRFS
ncbi:MAG: hypothetical protein PHY93_20825 [Bacteriovorax sp.]|nr:hypothetical protein [Bacteriovorax sp.]